MNHLFIATAGLILALAPTTAFSAEDLPKTPSPAYDLATPGAHHPRYDQKGLWPEDVQKTAYFKETWEPARLLVWSGPPTGKIRPEVWSLPANWQEYPPAAAGYGKPQPATTGPDEKSDVVVSARKDGLEFSGNLPARHLTIGSGVRIVDVRSTPQGNIWNDGYYGGGFLHADFRGKKNTFMRGSGPFKAKAVFVNKAADAAVELVGAYMECVDWMELNTGRLIAGPGAILGMGNRHQNIIAPKGTLVLMGGSTFKTYAPKDHDYDLDVFGKVLAGTPERPLTTDAVFLLNSKPKNKQVGDGNLNHRSLRLEPIGSITVNSADPAKARLVFRPWDDKALIDLMFAGNTVFDGVRFEGMELGGIQIKDEAVRKGWKNVTFGERNAGKPDEIFSYKVNAGLNGVWHVNQNASQQMKEHQAEETAKAKEDAAKAKQAGSPAAQPAAPAPK